MRPFVPYGEEGGMRALARTVFLSLGLLVLLTGCGNKVKVAAGLVERVARPIGTEVREVHLNPETVEGLADAVRVEPQLVRDAAQTSETSRFWPIALDSRPGTTRKRRVPSAALWLRLPARR
jgi:hypothetical protein